MTPESEACFLGIDVGTTNAKVMLIDAQARVLRAASREYPVNYPRSGWAEQDTEMWWSAVQDLLHEVVGSSNKKSSIRAVGVSGQMHGLVALDANHAVIRPAILWNDQRSEPQCNAIIEACGGRDGLLRLTNNGMLAGYMAPKILWMREHEPEACAQIAHVLLPKDYIRFRLTGAIATDVSDASGTGVFDCANRRWSSELLALLKLPEAWFPPALESTTVAGKLSPEIASGLGLGADIPVIAGGGDAVLQPLGSGVVNGEGLLVVGTGGNVTVPLAANISNEGGRLQVFCGVLPGSYVAMGATLSAGESIRWMRNLLRRGTAALGLAGDRLSFADLDQLAGESEPGARRTLFLPYLGGERCPHADASARGAFIGLSPQTSLGDLVRAIMEGVAFSLYDVTTLLERQGIRPGAFRLSGGGSQSERWRQIFAHVFDRAISTVTASSEGTAFGAALLAGMSQGRWTASGELGRLMPLQTVDQPDPALVPRYRALFDVYQRGYDSLASLFRDLVVVK